VQGDVHDIEADATHILLAERALLGGPLEGTVHVLLDLEKVLHSGRLINDDVGSIGLGSPAPNLPGSILVPLELLTQELGSLLHLGFGTCLAILNGCTKFVRHRLGNEVQAVVLVRRLGQTCLI